VAAEDFRPRQILRESGDLTLQAMEAAVGSRKDLCEAIVARRLARQARQRLLFRVLFQFTAGQIWKREQVRGQCGFLSSEETKE
jgi:hypothetical protein